MNNSHPFAPDSKSPSLNCEICGESREAHWKRDLSSMSAHEEDKTLKNRHTPGPWFQDTSAHNEDFSRVMLQNGFCIARVYPRPTLQESNANAALIASAPELLDLHKALIAELQNRLWTSAAILDRIYAAIAKAEGTLSAQ